MTTKTSTMTHEAISKALCDNAPLSHDQRAALLTLIARDKQEQAERDALVDGLKAEAKELKAFLRSRDANIVEQNRQLNQFRVLCADQTAELERLRAQAVPAVEDINAQDWAGMDGTTAYSLIERHAEDWWHAGRLMHAWCAANVAQQTPSLTVGEPVGWVNGASLASAKVSRERGGPYEHHTWADCQTAFHDTPVYLTAAQAEPVMLDGTLLEPLTEEQVFRALKAAGPINSATVRTLARYWKTHPVNNPSKPAAQGRDTITSTTESTS